jgi:TRAF3-interacting protein 1
MAEFWKPTAEMLGKLIQRPKMDAKNLTRPPFKFIVAVFSEVLNVTGFGIGLFNYSELNGGFDRDKKINFLEKIIKLTEGVLSEKIPGDPKTMIAGKECEQTNLFLQALYRAATTETDTAPVVDFILGRGPDPNPIPPTPNLIKIQPPKPETLQAEPPTVQNPSNSTIGFHESQIRTQLLRETLTSEVLHSNEATKDSEIKGISMKLRGRKGRADEGAYRAG